MNTNFQSETKTTSPYNKLISDYPSIYGQGFSFCVPDVWLVPLRSLTIQINTLLANYPEFSIHVSDVKEKFGELRFYFSLEGPESGNQELDQKIENVIEKAKNDIVAIGNTRAYKNGS